MPNPTSRLRAIPGMLTTDASVLPSDNALAKIAAVANSSIARAVEMAALDAKGRGENPEESTEVRLLREIQTRKGLVEPENARMRVIFDRMDNLYFPESITTGGPDHWPEGEKEGRVHVSLNSPPLYVDIPASLQAYPPVENYIPSDVTEDEREAAARRERLYFQWLDDDERNLKDHMACIVKGLYGFTYGKVYWDTIEKRPTLTVIEDPANLYVGWGDSNYNRMDWAIYCYGLSPQAVEEQYGVEVYPVEDKKTQTIYPYVGTHTDPVGSVYGDDRRRMMRSSDRYEQMRVEVYDYWYKVPGKKGQPPVTWNALYVGNKLVEHAKHSEYRGEMPYVPLRNTFIPGIPYGRPELWDLEQLIREKDERITNAGQMLASVVDGQRWQLIGPEAPDDVPANALPQANKVATPGPGNELKAIQPFVPQFAIEDYLKRLDSEMEEISGLNETLRGRAPAQVLSSSKAIAALVANYESRIRMKRDLYYQWRRRVWKLAARVWSAKDSDVRALIDDQTRIETKAPELTPRDEFEIAQMAGNLVNLRLWSMERGMDRTGVEDPSEEKALIREEQTDATLQPGPVTTQLQLVALAQQMGQQVAPPAINFEQGRNATRSTNAAPAGGDSLNAPENRGQAAPEGGATDGQANLLAQTLLQGGETKGRVLSQVKV